MTLEQSILADIKELPENLKQSVADYVQVLKHKYKRTPSKSSIKGKESIKKAFEELQKSNAFSNIKNPSNWKKALRDEWE